MRVVDRRQRESRRMIASDCMAGRWRLQKRMLVLSDISIAKEKRRALLLCRPADGDRTASKRHLDCEREEKRSAALSSSKWRQRY
ncbi:hypothetical protein CBR_g20457 [Chara braunii]|uniref:Uncharacterized protein n=1 Tax=Chara braunii TaxID=69332 RepID=A0A388JUE1_CHABU|nr:hypothetical protein CBR_g20457 [Chara braunii]|eukprot:GBG61426.1 hypothetical protein CBR_g20457 [Chara braunii]